MIIDFFFYLLTAFCISFLVTPFVIRFAHRFKLTDDRNTRFHPAQIHKGTVPRAGGLSIFIGIIAPVILFVAVNKTVIGILISLTLLMAVGIWDDRKDRSPYIRFITNCIAAVIVIISGVSISYITHPLGGIIHFDQFQIIIPILFGSYTFTVIADILALLWIVWTMNIVGWSGGVDGQLPGFVAISAIIIGILSLRFVPSDPSQIVVTTLSFVTAGSFLGFLPWNFYPQKIMPGYGGKTIAGFMLAVLSILSSAKLGTALLVLVIPMLDALFIFSRRILSGRSPVWASSGHLHHMLLLQGWGKRRIAIFYWLISLVAGVAALSLNSSQKIFAGIVISVAVLGFIMWVNLARKRFPKIY